MYRSQKSFTAHNVFSVCLTENTNMPLISSLLKGGKTFRLLDPSVIVAVHRVGRQEPKLVKGRENSKNYDDPNFLSWLVPWYHTGFGNISAKFTF